MAKKEKEKDLTKPVVVRAQTEEEVRKRLRSQGKLKDKPKEEDDGVRELTEDDAKTNIEDRRERLADEDAEENENVRPQTEKDIIKNQAARKERAENNEDGTEKTSRVQTEKDIKDRNDPEPDKDKEPAKDKTPEGPEPTDPPEEFYAKDVVTFKNDDGEQVTGKIKRVTSKGEAIIDIEEGDNEYTYTVPCDVLTKVDKEGK